MATTEKKSEKKADAKPEKKSEKKTDTKKNKLGVKNSLVNNINAKKEKGESHSKKDSTVSKKNYDDMEEGWDKNDKKEKKEKK